LSGSFATSDEIWFTASNTAEYVKAVCSFTTTPAVVVALPPNMRASVLSLELHGPRTIDRNCAPKRVNHVPLGCARRRTSSICCDTIYSPRKKRAYTNRAPT
jgi:hypothetical protein